MTDAERIAAILQSRSLVAARKLTAESPPGFEERLFEELKRSLGSNPEGAVRLAKVGEVLDGDREPWKHRFRGVRLRAEAKWGASANAFLRAEETSDDASMAIGSIDSFARAGRMKRALEEGERIFAALSSEGRTLDAGRAALNLGNALLWADEVTEARVWLERAVPMLEESPAERGAALLGLSTSQIDFGAPRDVATAAEQAKQIFQDLGLTRYVQICDQNLAQAALMEGRLDDALETFRALRGTLWEDGEDFARNEQFLGETYLRLNMPVEARQAFQDALLCKGMRGLSFNVAQVFLGVSHAESMLGNHERALIASERSRASFRRLGNAAGAALARAVVVLNDPAGRNADSLRILLEELRQSSLRRTTCETLCALAEVAQDASLVDEARTHAREFGLADLAWRVEAADARTCAESGRLDAYRRMSEEVWSSRALQRSTIARQHFLQDKDTALREFLGLLLSDGTEGSVAEALDVVRRSRSTSLIDEIVSARRPELDPRVVAEFERVREEIRASLPSDDTDGSTRRLPPAGYGEWQRAWRELEPLVTVERGALGRDDSDVTLITAGGTVHRVRKGRAKEAIAYENLLDRLRWVEFDLMEPIVNPNAGPERALSSIAQFGREILGDDVSGKFTTVSPDMGLWGVPWAPMFDARSPGTEPLISLAPAFSGLYRGLNSGEDVTIWYQNTPKLPHIQYEIEQLLALLPGALVCQTVAEVRESLHNRASGVLHIATHARLNRRNPMFSALQLSDGEIFAAEIARGTMRPRLVTMSACESGSLSTSNVNEPDGLVRAALALGAESVVASAWTLDDQSAREFTVSLYESLRDGVELIDAVQSARRTVRKSHPHPYYWGAMVTFGGHTT